MKMYRRKAFLHWYKGEGMDQEEFNESGNDLQVIPIKFHSKVGKKSMSKAQQKRKGHLLVYPTLR